MDSQRSSRGFAPVTTAEIGAPRRNRLALRPADLVAPRYADVTDQHLPRTLTAEDQSEEDGLERVTCRTHRHRQHDCVSSPLHVVIVTGASLATVGDR